MDVISRWEEIHSAASAFAFSTFQKMEAIFLELCSYHIHYSRGNIASCIFYLINYGIRRWLTLGKGIFSVSGQDRPAVKLIKERCHLRSFPLFLWHWVVVIVLRNGIFICSGTSKPSLVLKSFLFYLWIILQVLYEQSRRHRFTDSVHFPFLCQ